MSEIEKFFDSEQKLQMFLKEWSKPLDDRCKDNSDNQIRAAYYLWARYSLSIRTLRKLCEPGFLPDLFVLSRTCLEFNASLRSVLADKQIAEKYIEFEKHALCSYYRYLKDTKNLSKAQEVKKKISKMGVSNPDQFRSTRWCPEGYSSLVETYLGPEGKKLYSLFSDFVHGSIVALRFLENNNPQESWISKVIIVTYCGYINSAHSFLDKAWGPIITPDGEACKSAFVHVAKVFVSKC